MRLATRKDDTLRFLRDPTRGGLATLANELAAAAGASVVLREEAIPVREDVRAACELLGIDPDTIVNTPANRPVKLIAEEAPIIKEAIL